MTKLIIIALVAVLMLALATVAYAVSQSVIDAIIDDARDGMIDGDWTAAEIEAALAYLRDNPLYEQYADYEGILEDYLAGLRDPGVASDPGELAFTGAELLLLLGAGAGLVGGGAVLRRRRA